MNGVLFLCLITTRNALAQTVTWTVGTAVPRYTESVNLTCTVSADCCTSAFRVWENAAGVQILSDGVSSDPNKYEEDWNGGTTGFNLIIKNLAKTDVGTDYNCQYKLGNDKHTLTQDATWEYGPTESCPYSYVPFVGLGDSTFDVTKSAPSPSITASFEGKNLTSGLIITGPTNFDTWFYSFKVSIDTELLCPRVDAELKIKVVTGTKTTEICAYQDLCYPCWKCAVQCFAWALLGTLAGCLLTWLCYLICFCCFDSWKTRNYFGIKFEVKTDENCSKLYGKSYSKVNRNRALLISLVATISGCIVIACLIYGFFLFGSNCPNCKGEREIAAFIFGFGAFFFLVIFYMALNIFDDEDTCNLQQFLFFAGLELLSFLIFPMIFMIIIFCFWKKGDHTRTWQNILRNFCKVVGVIGMFILFPIIFLIIYFNHKKGGNNRSKESGSSCWPPCSVGPDPNSPDPENARSLLKKNADKKNEKKPVAVVRSQPPKNRHVKTDNTESTRYSAETEIFDEGVHKSAKPRPLPSIGQPTISPRPLPQMPPSSQLEKGGIQLEPLGDSTSEKKKKKRRKKKESKQSGDED